MRERIDYRWFVVVPVSVILGFIFNHFTVPAAWILAGIVASASVALSTGKELKQNPRFFAIGRGFIGILAGLPLAAASISDIGRYLIPGLLVSLVTLGIGIGGGYLLSHSRKDISTETGVLSMLAGGASMMPTLAKEVGADFRYVALTQYLRLLSVSVSLPLITHLISPSSFAGSSAVDDRLQPWWILVIIFAVAIFGERIGALVHLPVASVFGPLILIVLIGITLDEYSFVPPLAVQYVAFLAIGWLCGGSLSVPALKAFAAQLPATVTFILVLIAGCALSAWPLVPILGISYFEAYLATTPGALETVLALSAEGNAGPVVITIQLIRLICVLLLAGYLPQLLRYLREKRA